MAKKVHFGILIVITVILFGFSLCLTTNCLAKQNNWWDKFGKPQYGDTITYPVFTLGNITFDPWETQGSIGSQFPMETLFFYDWPLPRDKWSFQGGFYPEEFANGLLAESWEHTDPVTIKVSLRKGIHWQDKPPANGREFIADDVLHHYHRVLGTHGFSEPNPYYANWLSILEEISAPDDYTVVFKLKRPNAIGIFQLLDLSAQNLIENPEAVKLAGGKVKNWQNVVGTGPWIITDFVAGTALTLSRNPNYWGFDERHPENRLPYADSIKVLQIPDLSTQLAALRSGKLDYVGHYRGGIDWQRAKTLAKSNPELKQIEMPISGGALTLRVDRKPFDDIRVRKALQMAIDREAIAKGIYGGMVKPIPAGMVTPLYKGWCYAYEEWPRKLKNEYSFDQEKAKQLLAEAGYPDGFDTQAVIPGSEDTQVLESIKAYFSEIGIDMKINVMDPASAFAYGISGKIEQMWYASQCGNTWPVHIVITHRLPGDPRNFAYNSDPGYKELFTQFQTAASLDVAKQTLHDVDKYVIEHHYAVYVFPSSTYLAFQPYLKGYSGEILHHGLGSIFARLWIDQSLK